MSNFLEFLREQQNFTALDLQFIRVGKTAPLLGELQALTKEYNINWRLEEVDSLEELYVPKFSDPLLDGIILSLDVTDENTESVRRSFWNNFIWAGLIPLPLAIITPDESLLGSLSQTEIYRILHLIRLTDRPWKHFCTHDPIAILNWVLPASSSVLRRMQKQQLLQTTE